MPQECCCCKPDLPVETSDCSYTVSDRQQHPLLGGELQLLTISIHVPQLPGRSARVRLGGRHREWMKAQAEEARTDVKNHALKAAKTSRGELGSRLQKSPPTVWWGWHRKYPHPGIRCQGKRDVLANTTQVIPQHNLAVSHPCNNKWFRNLQHVDSHNQWPQKHRNIVHSV